MKRPLLTLLLFLLSPLPAFASPPSYVELEDAPTITVDWSRGNVQAVTLHGNRTLVFENGEKGGRYMLAITQDATGSRVMTWPSSVRWPGGSPVTFTTTPNKRDYIQFFYDGTNYDTLGLIQNF